MEGGLGREGYTLGKARLLGKIPQPVEPAQTEASAIFRAETQMDVMKARLRAPMRKYAEERGPTGNLARPAHIYPGLGIESSDPIAARAAFELVLELSEGRETELTWICPLIHFTHDFEGNLGGGYGGLAKTVSTWTHPVFLLACRTLKANEFNEWSEVESVWVEELITMMGANNATETFWEQLGQVLAGENKYFVSDTLWNRRRGR